MGVCGVLFFRDESNKAARLWLSVKAVSRMLSTAGVLLSSALDDDADDDVEAAAAAATGCESVSVSDSVSVATDSRVSVLVPALLVDAAS